MEIGDRVGVIQKAERDTVYLFGYGTYEGEHIPPDDVGGFNVGIPNPKLKLDDGTIIYGCESWWGPESNVRKNVGEFKTVVMVAPGGVIKERS